MTVNANKVLVGLADQSTTGAILSAPIGTALPTDVSTDLDKAYVSSGYCSDDGLSLTTDISTSDLKEWNGAVVRKVLESFDGTISFTIIQADYDGWCQAVGAENVERIAATAEHGEQLHIKMGAHLPKAKQWAFKMKDDDARMLISVPNGQVTNLDEITFNATDAVKLPITVSCYDDGTGESIHIYTDDGAKASA